MGDYSLNESAYRAKLAVRGVGYSWGVADDAARALHWLSLRGIDGFAALSAVLTDIDSNLLGAPTELTEIWQCEQSALCPIISGICVSDCASQVIQMQSVKLNSLAHPLLMLPFMSDVAARHNCRLHLNCSVFEALVSKDEVAIKGDATISRANKALISCADQLASSSDSAMNIYSQTESRVSIDAPIWHQLGEFAHRTYAPATEQSRLLGAGAGVVDSD